jgi:hypothetical protein
MHWQLVESPNKAVDEGMPNKRTICTVKVFMYEVKEINV